jgi:hypothetical protein
MVRIAAEPDVCVKPADVTDLLGLPRQRRVVPERSFMDSGAWPDYGYCLQHAWRKDDGTVDRSAADFLWCQFAAERGYDVPSVEAKLVEVSEKASEEWNRGNRGYVTRTVANAFHRARGRRT